MTELLEGDTEPFSFIHLWWLWIPWPCWLVEGTGSRSEEPEMEDRRGSAEAGCRVVQRLASCSTLFGGEGQESCSEVCGDPVVSETIQF